MKLRRLEFAIIGLTLAFACFMGGFFTGRSSGAVNIVSHAAQSGDLQTLNVSTGSQSTQANNNPQPQQTASPPESNIITSEPVSDDIINEDITDTQGHPRGGDGKININLATQSELTDLPGIGNVLASRIVDYRRMHGSFSRIEDLRNVSGIGEKRYEAIEDKITVG